MSTLRQRMQKIIIDAMKESPAKGCDLLGRVTKAEEEVDHQMFKKFIYEMMREEARDNPHYDPVRKLIFDVIDEKKKIKQYFKLISITPPDGYITKSNYLDVMNSVLRKKWVHQYECVIEQRGTTLEEMGKGAHIHILAMLSKPKGKMEIVREISQTLKLKNNSVNVKVGYDLEGARKYIRGLKEDHKMEAVALNSQWRKSWGAQEIYSSISGVFDIAGADAPATQT